MSGKCAALDRHVPPPASHAACVVRSAVKWKKGRNLTLIPVKERSRVKHMGAWWRSVGRVHGGTRATLTLTPNPAVGAGKRKTITRLKPCESFFNIFSGPILSGTGANEHDDHEEVRTRVGQAALCTAHARNCPTVLACVQLLNQIDADFEIGLTFKDKIVPRGFAWYTGEAAAGSSDDEVRRAPWLVCDAPGSWSHLFVLRLHWVGRATWAKTKTMPSSATCSAAAPTRSATPTTPGLPKMRK